jgi:hypothetical protein
MQPGCEIQKLSTLTSDVVQQRRVVLPQPAYRQSTLQEQTIAHMKLARSAK